MFISTYSQVSHQIDILSSVHRDCRLMMSCAPGHLTMVMVVCAWLWTGYLVFNVTPKHTCVAVFKFQITNFVLTQPRMGGRGLMATV